MITPVQKAIYERRAVRNYTAAAVSREQIMDLLHAAVQAPSAMNQQPWAFAVFQGREKLKSFSDRAKEHLAGAPEFNSMPPWLQAKIKEPAFNLFYNASTLIVICGRAGGWSPAEDCCLAAQNLMLAAHAMGLATCPIGLARPWLNLPESRTSVGIGADLTPVFPLIVGHPAGQTDPVPRNEPQIVQWT